MNQERHDPLKPLHDIMQLVDKKVSRIATRYQSLGGVIREASRRITDIQKYSAVINKATPAISESA